MGVSVELYWFRRIIQILGVNQPSAWVPGAYTVAESSNMPPWESYQPHIKVTFPGLKLYICVWAGTEWASGDVDKPAAN